MLQFVVTVRKYVQGWNASSHTTLNNSTAISIVSTKTVTVALKTPKNLICYRFFFHKDSDWCSSVDEAATCSEKALLSTRLASLSTDSFDCNSHKRIDKHINLMNYLKL